MIKFYVVWMKRSKRKVFKFYYKGIIVPTNLC